MSGSVLHKGDLLFIAYFVPARLNLIQDRTYGLHHLQVGLFGVTADVVGLTRSSAEQDTEERFGVILHIKPVTHIVAFAVNGNGITLQCFQDDDRDQFFGKLVRSVIVGAVGDQSW